MDRMQEILLLLMTRQMDRIQKRNISNISRVGVAGRPMGIRRFLSHYSSTANEIKSGVPSLEKTFSLLCKQWKKKLIHPYKV